MNKGRWVTIAVVLVAAAMAVGTWPLLKLRRRHEIQKTKTILEGLYGACEQYRTRFGLYPRDLRALDSKGGTPRDAWGRAITCEHPIHDTARGDGEEILLRSLGPDPDDDSDDILLSGRVLP